MGKNDLESRIQSFSLVIGGLRSGTPGDQFIIMDIFKQMGIDPS